MEFHSPNCSTSETFNSNPLASAPGSECLIHQANCGENSTLSEHRGGGGGCAAGYQPKRFLSLTLSRVEPISQGDKTWAKCMVFESWQAILVTSLMGHIILL